MTSKLFESQKRRKFPMFGKPCMIKTLATLKLVYLASMLCQPDKEYIGTFQRLVFIFHWEKSESLKGNTLGDITEIGFTLYGY